MRVLHLAPAAALAAAAAALLVAGPQAAAEWQLGDEAAERLVAALAPEPPVFAELRAATVDERCPPVPLAAATTAEGLAPAIIRDRLRDDPGSLGSATIGGPTRGALFNPVKLEESTSVRPVAPSLAWGTETTIASIERAAARVACRHPGGPPLAVGSISRKAGGYLWPHKSHQSGIDVDLGYFYQHGFDWYVEVTEDNLDRERTWTLIEALVDAGNVQYVFVGHRIKEMLRDTAVGAGAKDRLTLFEGDGQSAPVIRALRGHDDHIHVRFDDRAAQTNAALLMPYLWRRYRHLARR